MAGPSQQLLPVWFGDEAVARRAAAVSVLGSAIRGGVAGPS